MIAHMTKVRAITATAYLGVMIGFIAITAEPQLKYWIVYVFTLSLSMTGIFLLVGCPEDILKRVRLLILCCLGVTLIFDLSTSITDFKRDFFRDFFDRATILYPYAIASFFVVALMYALTLKAIAYIQGRDWSVKAHKD